MKIEILYEELCNLNGDSANTKYLEMCLKKATFIHTSILDEPKFVSEDINMIYMGPMSEKSQKIVLEKLMPYKDRIKELIEKKVIFLINGNAFDLFGNYIKENNEKIDCLGIFDFYVERKLTSRHNSILLGEFNNIEMMGFRSQFTKHYGNLDNYFIKIVRGYGMNENVNYEGIHYNNFFGTSLLGPILIVNPYFTKYIISLLGEKKIKLPFEEEIIDAYNKRLEEFKDLNRKV